MSISRELRPALVMLGMFTVLTGLVYPGAIALVAQGVIAGKANGSLAKVGGKVVGSELIAQQFTSARYFWPRPSACGYNAAASSGSNLAMSNPAFVDGVKTRAADLRTSDSLNLAPVPVDLVLASGSGLDPDISLEAANWQVARVAKERGLSTERVDQIVESCTEGRTFGVLGEPRVNVLELNLALDAAH